MTARVLTPIHRASISSASVGETSDRDHQGTKFRPETYSWDKALRNEKPGCCPDMPHWQDVVRTSICSNSLISKIVNEPADTAQGIELFPAYGKRTNRPVRAREDGSAQEREAWRVFSRIVNESGSQSDLIRRGSTFPSSIGESRILRYVAPPESEMYGGPDNPQTVYQVVDHAALERLKDGRWLWHRTREGERDLVLADSDVKRWVRGDLTHDLEAWSPLKPLAPLLALWEMTVRAIGAGVQSSLLISGIMTLDTDDKSWVPAWMDYIREMKKNPDIPVRSPWPMNIPTGSKLEFHEFGTSIQTGLIEIERMLTEAIARDAPGIQKLILEGPGEANQWGDVLTERQNLKNLVWPLARDGIVDAFTCWPFRPALIASNLGFDPLDWCIWGDYTDLANRKDNPELTFKMWCKGGVVDEAMSDASGVPIGQFVQPGTPEWDVAVARNAAFGTSSAVDAGFVEAARDRSDRNVGLGGETDGTVPERPADVSEFAPPVERASLWRERPW